MLNAVALTLIDPGRNVTPAGASPRAVGVATDVLVPRVGPRIQQMPGLPFPFGNVHPVDANVPHPRVPLASGAMVPPPAVTAQFTGTFVRIVPFAVWRLTPGRHSGCTAPFAGASIAVQCPLTTVIEPAPGSSSVGRPLRAPRDGPVLNSVNV